MKTIKFKGCKHLGYNIFNYDSRLVLKELPSEIGVCWSRPEELCQGIHKEVQFCK